MKNYLLLLLLLICFGLIIWIVLQKEPQQDNSKLIQAQKEIARSDSLQAYSNAIVTKLKQDSVNSEKVKQAQSKEIKRLQLKVLVTRSAPEVKKAIDSIPQVAEAFETDDSLTLMFMNRVDTLEAQQARLYSEGRKVLALKDSALNECQDANKVLESVVTDQSKDLKKGKRREKVLKTLIPIAIVIGLLVGL